MGFEETSGDVNGGVMDEGGGMEEDERPVERVEMDVDAEDSLDRLFGSWTSISSFTDRFRFREVVGGGVSVFMLDKLAATAFRFVEEDVERPRFRVMVPFVCVVEGVEAAAAAAAALADEERVCRTRGDLSGVRRAVFILLRFMALAYGDPSGSYSVSVSESK